MTQRADTTGTAETRAPAVPAERAEPTATQRLAWLLGLAGLLPFFAHALFAWLTSPYEVAGLLRSQVHYTAVILSFLGALHWGVMIASPSVEGSPAGVRMAWSVMPALYAWVVSLYPVDLALPLLFVALPVVFLVDLAFYRKMPVPRWFLVLRAVLTVGATACVGASWMAIGRLPL
jgi:hypothetical protein